MGKKLKSDHLPATRATRWMERIEVRDMREEKETRRENDGRSKRRQKEANIIALTREVEYCRCEAMTSRQQAKEKE